MSTTGTVERTYTLSSVTWDREVWDPADSPPVVDELLFDIFVPSIRTTGSFRIRWIQLRDSKPPCPMLEVFQDSWKALVWVQPILTMLGGERPQPHDVIEALEVLGFAPSEYHGQKQVVRV